MDEVLPLDERESSGFLGRPDGQTRLSNLASCGEIRLRRSFMQRSKGGCCRYSTGNGYALVKGIHVLSRCTVCQAE